MSTKKILLPLSIMMHIQSISKSCQCYFQILSRLQKYRYHSGPSHHHLSRELLHQTPIQSSYSLQSIFHTVASIIPLKLSLKSQMDSYYIQKIQQKILIIFMKMVQSKISVLDNKIFRSTGFPLSFKLHIHIV